MIKCVRFSSPQTLPWSREPFAQIESSDGFVIQRDGALVSVSRDGIDVTIREWATVEERPVVAPVAEYVAPKHVPGKRR